ncbi:hydantoinase/oxoprolinase family protein [Variovorax sp. RA8]|uniref:hydantoinase/oxoprolinase family protein n=1 Tax=Variovorax sp. (strain JCM 16519 / RA8) TaxID=662548 RepID=UPI001316AEF3|nr:hydantoinase/oxoprolinase family protein [Variovorax sp. RA8]VTU42831.1 Acetophenone carboxylase gamma subunit [Variovorax sp. RA8]
MSYRLGIDIGGTFTDFSLMNESTGQTLIAKVPSTPSHPSKAVLQGLAQFSERHAVPPSAVGYFVHGTTIGVNTLLERKGARTGLLITRGFRDILSLGRSRLPDIFDLLVEKPAPLIPRQLVRTIDERMSYHGEVLRPLDTEQVLAAVAELVGQGVEALAITFLHSYMHPAHERAAKEAIAKAYPDLFVCVSSDIWPQIREYERTLISSINAFIGKKMSSYFTALQAEVGRTGLSSTLLSTKSNGGVMTARSAQESPVETLSSGPASGAIGARFVARLSGFTRLIPLDMGGTSTEVAVIDEELRYANVCHIGDFDISLPAVDLSSIGAGGGSIAWTDAAGILKVGPESAGSEPGPACYARGGTRPTITDAYVTMGIVDPERFLGGELKLRPDLARRAIGGVAQALGMEHEACAEAILRVATSNMYSQLVPLMARKGVDVSEFALLCYGGAGATHGFLLAREVGIQTVLVPPSPGTLCALGSLVADVKSDFIRTVQVMLDPQRPGEAIDRLATTFEELERQALGWLARERISVADKHILRNADIRYAGQSFDVSVDLGSIDLGAADAASALLAAFKAAYAAIYGDADHGSAIEVVNLRTTAVGVTPKPSMRTVRDTALPSDLREPPVRARRRIFIDGAHHDAAVLDRSALTWGHEFNGPAVVEQYDTTTFVPPGFACRVDGYGMIIGELRS